MPHLCKCIQSFTHHYSLILSSVWAWLDTFLLRVASSHNHLMLSDSLFLMHEAVSAQGGLEYRRDHNWWRDKMRGRGWAYSSRPSLPRQNKPGEWKSSYQGDSRQIKGDCQEIIALVFKPWLAVSCHNKTEGMQAAAQRVRGRERKKGGELLICLACLLHATAVHLLWNGCIWNQLYRVEDTAEQLCAQACLSDPGRVDFTDELWLLTYTATHQTLITDSGLFFQKKNK